MRRNAELAATYRSLSRFYNRLAKSSISQPADVAVFKARAIRMRQQAIRLAR